MTEDRGAGFQMTNKTIRRGNPLVQTVLGPERIKILKVGKDRSTSEDGVVRSTGESENGPDRQKRKSSRIPNYWGGGDEKPWYVISEENKARPVVLRRSCGKAFLAFFE